MEETNKQRWMGGRKERNLNNGWMDGWMDGWKKERKKKRKKERKVRKMDGWTGLYLIVSSGSNMYTNSQQMHLAMINS